MAVPRGGDALVSFDPDDVTAVLVGAARGGVALTYSEVLGALGHTFSRPRMRQLCKTLDAVDEAQRGQGAPELAVLVVRQSNGLPGQGWWIGGRPVRDGYAGPWEGPDAAAYVRTLQGEAFRFWAKR